MPDLAADTSLIGKTAIKQNSRPSFRFITAKTLPLVSFPETKSINVSLPQESSLLSANSAFYAFALKGPGGRIGILRAFTEPTEDHINVHRGQRLLPAHMKQIVNGSDVNDFKLSPFRLASSCAEENLLKFGGNALLTGCEDGRCRIWHIPSELEAWTIKSGADPGRKLEVLDGSTDLIKPSLLWNAHSGKVTGVSWHPTIPGVLVSSSSNFGVPQVCVWQLGTAEQSEPSRVCSFECFTDSITSMSFSPEGARFLVATRDGKVSLFQFSADTKVKSEPLAVVSTELVRGACAFWIGRTNVSNAGELSADNGLPSSEVVERFGVTGIGKGNERKIYVYCLSYQPDSDCSVSKQVERVSQLDLAKSPSLQHPVYDSSLSLIYMMGRGESALTVCDCNPSTGQLSLIGTFESQSGSSTSQGVGQAYTMLPKTKLDVTQVQIAKILKLNLNNTLELATITVPRAKMQYFQDDLYPDFLDTSEPHPQFDTLKKLQAAVSARVSTIMDFHKLEPTKYVSLKPEGMIPLSKAAAQDPVITASQFSSRKASVDSARSNCNNADELKTQMSRSVQLMTCKSANHSRRSSAVASGNFCTGASSLGNKLEQLTVVEVDGDGGHLIQEEEDEENLRERRRRALIGQTDIEVKDDEWD